ncbi:MAG: DeoR/GlpR family transcriptional regulator [Trueperaceae bacterium]|nr:DeoR/GlpR family transcriptional regulator [Trueperaceae bacterium]
MKEKEARQKKILSLIAESCGDELLSTRVLAQSLNVSEVTIRRDLQALSGAGLINRQHGGVSVITTPSRVQGKAVGIILVATQGKFSHPFYNEVLEGADQAFQKLGYELSFVKTFAEVDSSNAIDELLQIRPIKGLLVIGELNSERLERWTQRVDIVITTPQSLSPAIDAVLCDSYNGINQLSHYLHKLGKRRIAFISASGAGQVRDSRLMSYLASVKELGFEDDPELLFEMEHEFERHPINLGKTGAEHLMALRQPPEVIMCLSDMIAIGALQWLQENGFSVPEEVGVTGFDNIPESEFTFPPLTTVHAHKRLIGRLAAEQLHRRAQNMDDPPLRILTPTSLIIRKSCVPVPSN